MEDNSTHADMWREDDMLERERDKRKLAAAKAFVKRNRKHVYRIYLDEGGYVDTTTPDRWLNPTDERNFGIAIRPEE